MSRSNGSRPSGPCRHHRHRVAGKHHRVRPVPQPQVRPLLSEGLLPDDGVLRQRGVLGPRRRRRGRGQVGARAGARAADTGGGETAGGPATGSRHAAVRDRDPGSLRRHGGVRGGDRGAGAGLHSPRARVVRGGERRRIRDARGRLDPDDRGSQEEQRHLYAHRSDGFCPHHGVSARSAAGPVPAPRGSRACGLRGLHRHRRHSERRRPSTSAGPCRRGHRRSRPRGGAGHRRSLLDGLGRHHRGRDRGSSLHDPGV